MRKLLDDSINFVQYFDDPIRASAAHIYVSGIAFTPAETVLSKTYSSKASCIPKVRMGVNPLWPPICYERQGPIGRFSPCAISPDGSRFVFPHTTTIVRLWEVATGSAIASLDTSLSSVSFSRDGSQIVTSSYAGTIYLWDGRGGAPIGGPFTLLTYDSNLDEYLEGVLDVEVSADGTHIFSQCLMFSPIAHHHKCSFHVLDIKTGADSTHLYTTPNPGQSVIRQLKMDQKSFVYSKTAQRTYSKLASKLP